MGKTLAYKILENHLIEGTLSPGEEIKIKIDQTLTQDSTGTMVYLQLEAMDVEKIQTELSVAYIDHNTLQTGFENADDHEFIRKLWRRGTAFFFQSRATKSVTSSTSKISVFRERPFSVLTVILRPAAASV